MTYLRSSHRHPVPHLHKLVANNQRLYRPAPIVKLTQLPDDVLRKIFEAIATRRPYSNGTPRPRILRAMLPLAATCRRMFYIFQTSLSTLELRHGTDSLFQQTGDVEISLFLRRVGSFVTRLTLGPLRWVDHHTIRAVGSHCLKLKQLDISLLACVNPMELEAMFMLTGARLNTLRLSSGIDGRCSNGELTSRVAECLQRYCVNLRRFAIDHLHIGSYRAFVALLRDLVPQLEMLVLARLAPGMMTREVWNVMGKGRNLNFLHVVTSEGMGPLHFGRVLRRLIRYGRLRRVRIDGPDLMHGIILGCVLSNVHGMREFVFEPDNRDCFLPEDDVRRLSICEMSGFENHHARIAGKALCQLREVELTELPGLGDAGFSELMRYHESTIVSVRITRCAVGDKSVSLLGLMRYVTEIRLTGLSKLTDAGILTMLSGRKGKLEILEVKGVPEVVGWAFADVCQWGRKLKVGYLERKFAGVIRGGMRGHGRLSKVIHFIEPEEILEDEEVEGLDEMLSRVADVDVDGWSSDEECAHEVGGLTGRHFNYAIAADWMMDGEDSSRRDEDMDVD